jgi:hypothetical protein
MGDVSLQFVAFTAEGRVCGGGSRVLPDWLDWKSIDEKEVYLMHMGGFPSETDRVLITSQGARKLCVADDASREPVDYKMHRRREDGAEAEVERICRERGIDRTRKPGNQ